jgi:acyl-CoA thioester hydrolase
VSRIARDPVEVIGAEWTRIAPILRMDVGPQRVAFHSPCTLQHGMKLAGRVEEILLALGLELTPVADAHLCCGSSGTYSLLQPKIARELKANKLAALEAGTPESDRNGEHRLSHASCERNEAAGPALDRTARRADERRRGRWRVAPSRSITVPMPGPPTIASATRADYRSFLAIPTRWMDNDAYGHVNNVTYYSYFDTVVNEHLINVGGLDIVNDPIIGYVVETQCIYRKPLSFPEAIDAGMRVVKLGTSSVIYEIGIFRRGEDGRGGDGPLCSRLGRSGNATLCADSAEDSRGARAARHPGARVKATTVPVPAITCAPMSAATRAAAHALLAQFLGGDTHYRASSAVYGDGGAEALSRALDLFIARPELGFVWLAFADENAERVPVGACVVCRAISTSRGAIVAKLDDVTIAEPWQGRGVGGAMLGALCTELALANGVSRIDTACHRDNAGAWRFLRAAGLPTSKRRERIALLLD